MSSYIDLLQTKISRQLPNYSLLFKKSKSDAQEGYVLSRVGKTIVVESNHSLATTYALTRLSMGIASNHQAEYLGNHAPAFAFRPMWFTEYDLSQFDQLKAEKVSKRLIHWGFNAIVLNWKGGDLGAADGLAIFHDYGLKVVIRPVCDDRTVLPDWLKHLQKHIDFIDYVWLEASFAVSAQRLLKREIALKEVQLFESILKKIPLIYYVPYVDEIEIWLPDFFDDVAKSTIIAFSASTMEPFWKVLRTLPDSSSTRLLPVIDGGLVDQGGGLWPHLPIDILGRYVSRSSRHCFAGAVMMAKYFPVEKGWLDAALWISGQCLWDKKSPDLLAETWFQAFYPQIEYTDLCEFLKEMDCVIKKLLKLKTVAPSQEEGKIVVDGLSFYLRALSFLIEKKKFPHQLFACFFRFENDAESLMTQHSPNNRKLYRESPRKEIDFTAVEDF